MKKIIGKFKEFDWTIEAQLTFLSKSMFPLPLIFTFHYFNRTSMGLLLFVVNIIFQIFTTYFTHNNLAVIQTFCINSNNVSSLSFLKICH